MWLRYAYRMMVLASLEDAVKQFPEDVANYILERLQDSPDIVGHLVGHAKKLGDQVSVEELRRLESTLNLPQEASEKAQQMAQQYGLPAKWFDKWDAQISSLTQHEMQMISDWVGSGYGKAQHIMKIKPEDALAYAEEWHKFLHDPNERLFFPDEDVENIEYAIVNEDGQPNGWTIRKVTEESCKIEGNTMEHCVGGYRDKIKKGRSLIYSLRDPGNQPHLTIEMKPDGKINQFYGKRNSRPKDEYREMANQWFAQADNIWGIIFSSSAEEIRDMFESGRLDIDNDWDKVEYLSYVAIQNDDVNIFNLWEDLASQGSDESPIDSSIIRDAVGANAVNVVSSIANESPGILDSFDSPWGGVEGSLPYSAPSVEMTEILLADGIEPREGMLDVAARRGNSELFHLYSDALSGRAFLDEEVYREILESAIEGRNADIISFIVEHKAQPDLEHLSLVKDQEIHNKATDEDIANNKKIREIITNGVRDSLEKGTLSDIRNRSDLSNVILFGDVELLKEIIDYSDSDAIHFMVQNGDIDKKEILITNAIDSRSFDMLRYIIEEFNLHNDVISGATLRAWKIGNINMLKYLLDYTSATTHHYLLGEAINKFPEEISEDFIRYLIHHSKTTGVHALSSAISNGISLDLIQELIRKGPQDINRSLVEMAQQYNRPDVARYIESFISQREREEAQHLQEREQKRKKLEEGRWG